ncbi:MAG: DNA cytosine methyltransferase, partial [Kiritimatiellaeota bacterium]|nr:DNA cytosine methyltransferase [Kiritimatiellota bacterium]
KTVCAVEIDPYAACVLRARQGDGLLEDFTLHDDVRTFDGRPWRGRVDVISGGFPCQDISNAGKGAGIKGERSGLWTEFARIIREVQPPFAFVENSPMLASRGLDVVLADLAEMGFDAEWCVLGADALGAPHHRERMWILAAHPDRQRGLRPQPQTPLHPPVKLWQHEKLADLLDACPAWPDGVAGVDCIPHGMAHWRDELKALGNGQVPCVAARAWQILSDRLGIGEGA